MTKDELREAASAENMQEADMESSMREEAEARGVAVPDQRGQLPLNYDMWTYADVPEEGNATIVAFRDGKVFMVSYTNQE